MKRKNFYSPEMMETKEYRIEEISNIHYDHGNLFEKAAVDTIKKLKEKIKSIEAEIEKHNNAISKSYIKNGKYSKKDDERHAKIRDLNWDIDENEEHIFAFNEMLIIYLFKNLEISMKILVRTAYPKIDTKGFFRWDNMNTFFREKGIQFGSLKGFVEVEQLRKINNGLKHSDYLDVSIKKIPEFNDDIFGSNHMEKFYGRIRPKIDVFKEKLAEAVIKDLFEFTDEKLGEITTNLSGRMDKKTAKKFISLFEDKLKNLEKDN